MWNKNPHSSNCECSQIVDMLQLESRRWLEGERLACRALAKPLQALPLHPHTHIQKHTCVHAHNTHKICFLVSSTGWKPQMPPMPWWSLQTVISSWETNVARVTVLWRSCDASFIFLLSSWLHCGHYGQPSSVCIWFGPSLFCLKQPFTIYYYKNKQLN